MTRIVIIGSIRLYREGLKDLMAGRDGLSVVDTAADRVSGVAAVRELRPDVVVVDMGTPQSMEAIREILAEDPDGRVVALAVPDAEGDVIACAEAGVVGYVTREASLADLVAAVESAARGEARCSPRMVAAVLRRLASLAAERDPAPTSELTFREREIAELIGVGLSNKQIAQRLCIEVSTVKNHVHNILAKLNVDRRTEAAARLNGRHPELVESRDPRLAQSPDPRLPRAHASRI